MAPAALRAMKQKSGEVLCGAVADRGFDSKASERLLAQEQAFNGICPKDPGNSLAACAMMSFFARQSDGAPKPRRVSACSRMCSWAASREPRDLRTPTSSGLGGLISQPMGHCPVAIGHRPAGRRLGRLTMRSFATTPQGNYLQKRRFRCKSLKIDTSTQITPALCPYIAVCQRGHPIWLSKIPAFRTGSN